MSWRDHVLEWLFALVVAVVTLVTLNQIERRAAPPESPAQPPPESPVQGG